MIQEIKKKKVVTRFLKREKDREYETAKSFLYPSPRVKELPLKNNRAHRKESIIYMYNQ